MYATGFSRKLINQSNQMDINQEIELARAVIYAPNYINFPNYFL